MSRFAIFASAAGAVALLSAAPAAADYVIEEDPAMPSVVYVSFDPATMPKVYMAPSAGDLGLQVINGGEVQADTGVKPGDPNSPDLRSDDKATADNKDDEEEDDPDSTASVSPLEDRINDRVEALSRNQPQFEDQLIDREIEDRLLQETDRLLR